MKRKRLFGVALFLMLLFFVLPSVAVSADEEDDFKIENGVLISYTGSDAAVTVPDGVEVNGERIRSDGHR